MSRRGVSNKMPKAPIMTINTKFKDINVGTMVTKINRMKKYKMGTISSTTTSTRVTMIRGMIRAGL